MRIAGTAFGGMKWLAIIVALMLCGPLLTLAFGSVSVRGDWSRATHRPAGFAPDPAMHPEAIVQAYAGRTFGWRGAFSVHTWIAVKPAGAQRYTRYEVIGWYARGGGSGLSIADSRAPDAEWYGAAPTLIADLRGAKAQAVIARLPAVVEAYPYDYYRAWPGPNSNTFIAYVARMIPQMELAMPSNAIGKDYVPLAQALSPTPSGTGYQRSLAGLLGIAAARDEGIEVNVFGLVAGVDLRHPALKLPGVGRFP